MLASFIESQIYTYFNFKPTFEQKKIIFSLSIYLTEPQSRGCFILNGYAGTGKTSIIGAVVATLKELKINSVLLAPTGRAAKVMSVYSGSKGRTIHRHIYRKRSKGDLHSKFSLDINKDNDTVYIIDEASMISDSREGGTFGSGSLLADLFEYIETGHRNKIIMVGDSAQLPPVGYCESPALDISLMQMFCEPEYHTLSQVMRQGEDSGILYNATLVREMIESEYVDTPALHLSDDVIRVGGMDLIEMLEDSYSRYGKQGCAVITRSNKRANRFNQGIRQMILTHQEEIESGDLLMVVKNNYAPISESKDLDFIANGDMVMVRRIMKIEERYGFRFAYALLSLPDYDELSIERWIILDTLHVEAPSLNQQQQEQLFRGVEQEYMDITIKRKRIEKVLEDEFYNALQVKFAYAFTCHKAQGGQWHDIYIDTLLFGDEPMTMEFARWLYTAITRATGKVYFVGWDGSFFDNYIED